jgi:hypothetical protein
MINAMINAVYVAGKRPGAINQAQPHFWPVSVGLCLCQRFTNGSPRSAYSAKLLLAGGGYLAWAFQ